MTTDDSVDLITFVHPADGSVVPHEITEEALKAAVAVFMGRNIGPAAAASAWHTRDHFTQLWVATAPQRQKPMKYSEFLATFQPPAASQRMDAAAQAWDDAQAAAAKAVADRMPGAATDAWVFERVPTPEKRKVAAARRRAERF